MAKEDPWPVRGSGLRPAHYSDGHPLDEVQYLECKIILKADRFKSADSFREFGKLVRRTGKRELAQSISLPRWRCTARWTCASGWSRRRRS